MRFTIFPVAFAGLIGCDSSTAPETSIIGDYNLVSINGDTVLVHDTSDGGQEYRIGFATIDAAGTYSYAFLRQTCFFNGCSAPEVDQFSGTWKSKNSDLELTDQADGSVALWHYSNHSLSGHDIRAAIAPATIVFHQCSSQGQPVCPIQHFIGG